MCIASPNHKWNGPNVHLWKLTNYATSCYHFRSSRTPLKVITGCLKKHICEIRQFLLAWGSNFQRILLEHYTTNRPSCFDDIQRAVSQEDARGRRMFVRCILLEYLPFYRTWYDWLLRESEDKVWIAPLKWRHMAKASIAEKLLSESFFLLI